MRNVSDKNAKNIFSKMKVIKITEIENVKIGNAENLEKATGCTVILFGNGAPVGVDVRGGGPASRESELLTPLASAEIVHACLLSGGSAFGLDAAGGVQKYLEERKIGLDVGVTRVPLVCQSCLYDLAVGDPMIRPDAKMAYEACENAEKGNYKDGSIGAGTGATVGKFYGMDTCMKSGIGSYAVQLGKLKVGALVAVNAWGDIFDWKTGEKVAGLLSKNKTEFSSLVEEMYVNADVKKNKFVGNTTIGIILTNAKFKKYQMNKVAGMTQDGYARAIRPVHTSVDGDSIYAASTGNVEADIDVVGTLAADVMAEAVLQAVKNATSAYGIPSMDSLK